jgi:ubiquitin-protein ligase
MVQILRLVLIKVLLCIDSALGEFPSDDAFFINKEVAFVLKESREQYEKTAREWTAKYAMSK